MVGALYIPTHSTSTECHPNAYPIFLSCWGASAMVCIRHSSPQSECSCNPYLPARHLFGTLCGLHSEYKRLADNKKANFRVHITALDHHDVMLTRDLTVLMLLHQLNTRPGTVQQDEIQATLMYVYCGMAMPQYCFERYVRACVIRGGPSVLSN